MTETKFTPGPWAVTATQGNVHSQARNGQNWICQGPNAGAISAPPDDEQRANAHLIAAAPDLYEALQRMILDPDDISAAFDVLCKARGEA